MLTRFAQKADGSCHMARVSTASASGTIRDCRSTSTSILHTASASNTALQYPPTWSLVRIVYAPSTIPLLTHDVEYHSHTSGVDFYSSPLPYIAVGGGVYTGRVINYSPPSTSGPDPVNVTSPNLNLEIKPIGSIDLNNSYVYTHFTNPSNGAVVYDNHELISRWNYQMTKSISFNLIGQYISTLPNPQYTSATNSKDLFADALFTYHPASWNGHLFWLHWEFCQLESRPVHAQSEGACNTERSYSADHQFIPDERRQNHLPQDDVPAALLSASTLPGQQ